MQKAEVLSVPRRPEVKGNSYDREAPITLSSPFSSAGRLDPDYYAD